MRLLCFLSLLLAACTTPSEGGGPPAAPPADSGRTYFPGAQWRTAAPAQVNLDPARVETLQRDVARGRYGAIDAVIVVRFGSIVHEQYNGWPRERVHTLQSVTKSVTSLLFGILQASKPDGASLLDQPVLDVFGRYAPIANTDDRKRALTLRHLLMMRTSMDFYEQPYPGSPLETLNNSRGDWTRYILDRPMTGVPGSTWAYNSGAAILMCSVVRELSGDAPDAFARRELFAPLGITGETWARSPFDGLPHCGGGLNLRASDLARIGYLVLRNGRWNDRQVVPSSWIMASTTRISRGPELIFSTYNSGYGYFWWTFPLRRGGEDASVIAASGAGGQWLFVVPQHDLVVAVVATNSAGLDLLYDGVLPAVR